jgi:hypothetical protein
MFTVRRSTWLEAVERQHPRPSRLFLCGGLRRQNYRNHVKGLLRRRTARPDCVERRALVTDIGPALTGQFRDFGAGQ